MSDTTTDNPVIPVVLRVWKNGDGAFALFPTLPSDNYGYFCESYEHVGGHGGADYHHCIEQSRPARGEGAVELTWELEQIGYWLRVVKRATLAMHDKRCDTANKVLKVLKANGAS